MTKAFFANYFIPLFEIKLKKSSSLRLVGSLLLSDKKISIVIKIQKFH